MYPPVSVRSIGKMSVCKVGTDYNDHPLVGKIREGLPFEQIGQQGPEGHQLRYHLHSLSVASGWLR